MANQIVASVYQIDGNPQGTGEPSNNYITSMFPTSQILMFEATISTISYVNAAIQFYNNPLQPNQYQTFYVSETLTELVAAANVGGTTQVELNVKEIDNNPLGSGDDGSTYPTYSFPAAFISEMYNTDGQIISFKGLKYSVTQDPTDTSLSANSGDYKVYTALLTQSGTDAPVATVLQNTLGGTVVWTRDDVGIYTATLALAFTTNKTFVPPVSYYNIISDSNRCFYQGVGSTESALKFNQFDFLDAAPADVTSSPTGYIEIEIRVFP